MMDEDEVLRRFEKLRQDITEQVRIMERANERAINKFLSPAFKGVAKCPHCDGSVMVQLVEGEIEDMHGEFQQVHALELSRPPIGVEAD